jgi:hypothetical protein
VTTVRDLGSRSRVVLELRDAIAAGVVPGPRVLACGRPITSPDGHCHFLGGVARGVEAVCRLASELIEEGVDAIKVMGTGGNMTRGSDPLQAQLSVDELRAVVEVARAAGRRVTVHARGVAGMRAAVEAGVDGVGVERVRPGSEAAAVDRLWAVKPTGRFLVREFVPEIAEGELADVFFGSRVKVRESISANTGLSPS